MTTYAVTLNLPSNLYKYIEQKASLSKRSVEAELLNVLATAVKIDTFSSEDAPIIGSPEQVVAQIKATPPNPQMIHPPQASLAEALASLPADPTFDLAEWQQQWDQVEAQLKAIEVQDRLNDKRLLPE